MNITPLKVALAQEIENFATQEYHNKITPYNITGLTLAIGAIIDNFKAEHDAATAAEAERVEKLHEESGEET